MSTLEVIYPVATAPRRDPRMVRARRGIVVGMAVLFGAYVFAVSVFGDSTALLVALYALCTVLEVHIMRIHLRLSGLRAAGMCVALALLCGLVYGALALAFSQPLYVGISVAGVLAVALLSLFVRALVNPRARSVVVDLAVIVGAMAGVGAFVLMLLRG